MNESMLAMAVGSLANKLQNVLKNFIRAKKRQREDHCKLCGALLVVMALSICSEG
jgi:hypothetical protein